MRIISLLFYALATLPITANLERFDGFPWDSAASFERNLEPYLMIAISIFAFYQIRRVIEPLIKKEGGFPAYTEKSRGFIRDINYSDTRINYKPLFKAKVFYSGNEIEFDLLPESFQFNFSIGDEVVIRHHPEDASKATLDVDLSIEQLRSAEKP